LKKKNKFDLHFNMKNIKKNYEWLGSIGNANTSNEKSKLQAYLNLGSKLMISLWLLLLFTNLQAQTPMTAPALEWEKSYWPTTHLTLGAQTREQSGEDWFYSITKSINTNNVQNGYMCSGYNSFVNYTLAETSGCLDNTEIGPFYCEEFEKDDHRKGMVEGMISFVDLEGNKLWHQNLREGELTKIIRTSDGNYLAVGTTMSTKILLIIQLLVIPIIYLEKTLNVVRKKIKERLI